MKTAPVSRPLLQLAGLLAIVAIAATAIARPSNKWRLEFAGKSKVAGEIELSVTPQGGIATSVVVVVPARSGENATARLVSDSLKATFGDVYHVEVDDGEDVLVKARGGAPDFEVVTIRNTAEGIRLGIDRE
ncbi:hypothetical protein [Pseudoxanthomonas suwonensis]|uniref:hypothetical protein n=1 Tax=Pseudoxanthomonas suwonensis TaxID=314722 RepID=UPI000AC98BDE|nr:hypothetical protein [Pseudoxanthomonas suwonensis]